MGYPAYQDDPGGNQYNPVEQDAAEAQQARDIAASRPLPMQAIGGTNIQVPLQPGEDQVLPPYQAPAAPAPDATQPPPAAAPTPDQTPAKPPPPPGWDVDTWNNGFTLGRPEDVAPPPAPSIGGAVVGGLERAGADILNEAGGLVGTTLRKVGQWTSQEWLQKAGDALDDFDKQTKKAADDANPVGDLSVKDAWDQGKIMPWIVDKVSEGTVNVGSLIALGTVTKGIGPVVYGALTGANDEAKNPNATVASVLEAGVKGGVTMGMPSVVAATTAGMGFFVKLLAQAGEFGGLGALQSYVDPLTNLLRTDGKYEAPTAGQVATNVATSVAMSPAAVVAGKLLHGEPAKPGETGETQNPVNGGAPAEGTSAATVDPDVAAATQLALPPPSPGNRPPVINVPPTGADQVSRADIIPPPEGTVERPPLKTGDADTDAALRLALPPPSPENRPPTISVPPTDASQVSRSDIIAPPEGTVDRPPLTPPTLALPPPTEANRPPVQPVRPGEGQVSPSDIVPPQPGTVDYPTPPRPPTDGEPPPPERPPTPPTPPPIPGGGQVAAYRTEPDDATPGQHVAKDAQGNVVAVGDTPEQALAFAQARDAAKGGGVATGEASPTFTSVAPPPDEDQRPRAAAGEILAEPAAATTGSEPTPPKSARDIRREQMKPAAQAVLAKANQELAAKRAAGEEPAAAGKPETPPALASLLRKRAPAQEPAKEEPVEPAALPAKETPLQRAARIRKEVAEDLSETAEPPATAAKAARGMENIADVAATEAEKAPTVTAKPAVSVAEAEGREPSELKSDRRAASTTSLELKAGDLLHDMLEHPDKMSPVKAYDTYGEPSGTGGHPRKFDTLLHYLKDRISLAKDPKALDNIIARAKVINDDPKLSTQTKQKAAEGFAKEIERMGIEQDRLPDLIRIHKEIQSPALRRAARARDEAKADSDAALAEMEEANRQEDTKRTLGSPDALRGRRQALTEESESVNRPNWELTERSATDGVTHDLHDHLDAIIANPSARALTPHLVELAQRLKATVDRGVNVVGSRDTNRSAEYDPDRDEIFVHPDAASHVRATIHEGIHAATVHFLRDVGDRVRAGLEVAPRDRQLYDGLTSLAREVQRVKSQGSAEEFEAANYALSSEAGRRGDFRDHEELITQALTDPHLMDLLSRTDASPQFLRDLRRLGLSPEGARPSVWDGLKTVIGRMLGLGSDRVSVLDAALRPLTETLEAGGGYRRQTLKEFGDLPLSSPDRLGSEDRTNPKDDFRARVAAIGNKGVLGGGDNAAADTMFAKARRGAPDVQRGLNAAGLLSGTTDQIVRWNKDVVPALEDIRDARAKATAVTTEVHGQWGDRIKSWVKQLSRAGDGFTDLRNRVSEAQADVIARDFDAANAHLSGDDLTRARSLKAEYDKLPEGQKNLFANLTDYERETGYAERQAAFEDLVQRAVGDQPITDAERTELGRVVRSKAKLDELVNDPDASDLAKTLGERWESSRSIVQEAARIQSKGWMRGNYTQLQRHGDYIVTIGDPNDENYGVRFFDRRGQAEVFREQFAKDNPGVDISPVKAKATTSSNRYTEFVPDTALTDLKRTMEQRGIVGEDADKFLDAFAGMMLQRGAQSSRWNVARRNVAGASADGVRNLQRNFEAHAARMGHFATAADEYRAYQQAAKQVQQIGQARSKGTAQEIAESKARLDAAEARYKAGDPEFSRAEIEDLRQQHAWLRNPPTSAQAIRAGQAFEEMKLRRTPIDGDNTSRFFGAFARRFTGMSFVMQLMRPAHMLVQMLDAHSNGLSILGGEYGVGRASAAMARAMMQLAPEGMRSGGRAMLHAVGGKLQQADWQMSKVLEQRLIDKGMPAEEARPFVQALNDRGLIDVSLERELQRMAHPGAFSFGGDATTRMGHLAGNTMDLFAVGEHSVDALNRMVIAKAGYDLAKTRNGGKLNDGISDREAIRAAVEHASDAMPNYNLWNKPRLATERGPLHNPLIAATMQYKIYGMHLYSVMANLVRQAATRPEERASALKTLALMMATHSLLVGATANMMGAAVNTVTGLWDLLSGKKGPHNYENDLRRAMTDAWGPTASTFLSRGALGVAGIDLHRSLKLSNMVDLPEIKTFDRDGVAGAIATMLTGASGEVAEQFTDAAHQLMTGNFQRGLQALTPRIVGDIGKAYQLSHQGMVDSRGNVIVPASRISPSTPALRGLGFNPMETSLDYDRRSAIEEQQNEMNYARQQAEDAFVQNRDMSKVRAYNADRGLNKGYTISIQDLQEALKRSQGRVAVPGTYGLQIPKKRLPGALEAGRFS
jgi:hypothetical protein